MTMSRKFARQVLVVFVVATLLFSGFAGVAAAHDDKHDKDRKHHDKHHDYDDKKHHDKHHDHDDKKHHD
ncbi:hypothetical protein SAMN04487948_103507, partial [Halogranum amylolyticum]